MNKIISFNAFNSHLIHRFKFAAKFRLSSFFGCQNIQNAVSNEEKEKEMFHTIAWVQSIRKHKKTTFLNLNDGTSAKNLQVVCPTDLVPIGISIGSAVGITGSIIQREVNAKHACEMVASSIKQLSNIQADITDPTDCMLGAFSRSRPKLGLLRSDKGLAWRHRLPEIAAMLRLRAICKSIINSTFREQNYLEVDTPILTTTDCEGAGQAFVVNNPAEKKFCTQESLFNPIKRFSQLPVHLTVSAQLHLEALTLGLGKVYTLNPVFRAEPSHSRFHLAEFLMLEAESVSMNSVESLCSEIELIVRSATLSILSMFENQDSESLADLNLVLSLLSESGLSVDEHISGLHSMLSTPFGKVTYSEAIEYLEKNGKRSISSSHGLGKEEEQMICSWLGDRPVFVTDFPSSTKPFYCSSSLQPPNGSSSDKFSAAVDLLVPGIGELVGGSVRESNLELLVKKMKLQGLSPDCPSMKWYSGLRGYGGAPHGGFGLGFDRLLMWTLGVYNIRDIVPFPREISKIYL